MVEEGGGDILAGEVLSVCGIIIISFE